MTREALIAQTLAALRERAAALSITGCSRMGKAALIEAILSADPPEEEAALPADWPALHQLPSSGGAPRGVPGGGASSPRSEAGASAAVSGRDPHREASDTGADEAAVSADAPRGEAGAADAAGGEPSAEDLFIDRGEPVPDAYPGERMRALIRDPGSLYVYWESEQRGSW